MANHPNGSDAKKRELAETQIRRLCQLLLTTAKRNRAFPDMSHPDLVAGALAGAIQAEVQAGRAFDIRLFIDPLSGKPFVANAALSHTPLSKATKHAESIAFYAPQPHQAQRLVAWCDGRVEWVEEANWNEPGKPNR